MADAALDRFITAQTDIFDEALAELTAGRKRTHWMWFVFPQLARLGRSPRAFHYGLSGLDEARAYLGHPVLSDRLRRCVRAVLMHRDKSATRIFGFPDDAKLRSCLTLFEAAASSDDDRCLFGEALDLFFAGRRDGKTLSMIGSDGAGEEPVDPADVERLGAIRDPSQTQLVTMIKASPVRAVRRIICERTGAVWCWPAERASHADGARLVGATYTKPAGGDVLTLD